MNATIIGGTGFVGRHLLDLLKRDGTPAAIVSNEPSAAAPGVVYHSADISREAEIVAALDSSRPAQVYHLAALTTLAGAAQDSRLAFDVNVWGTRNVLEACSRLPDPPRVLNISSSQVYGPVDRQIDESTPIAPSSVYGATKAMAEMWASLYSSQIQVITARSFNHTGPGQTDAFVLPHFARTLIEIEAGLRPPILQTGNLQIERDFTDVRDVVRAYVALMHRGRPANVYNVCSGMSYRLSDLLEILLNLVSVKVSVEVDKSRLRSNDTPRIWGDHSKLTEHTGWQPSFAIEQTLRDLLTYYRSTVTVSAANRA